LENDEKIDKQKVILLKWCLLHKETFNFSNITWELT
jgi:hypothetical protein